MNKEHLIDLMYLFKDGESTPEERAHLFENLAYSSDLQNEFHELVCIENTVGCETSIISPQPYIKSRLFKKAGIRQNTKTIHYLMNFAIYSFLFVMGFLFNSMIASDNQSESPIVQKTTGNVTPVQNSTNALGETVDIPTKNEQISNSENSSFAKHTQKKQPVATNNIKQEIALSETDTKEDKNHTFMQPTYADVSKSKITLDQRDYSYSHASTQEVSLPLILEQEKGFLDDFELSASMISGLYIFPQRNENANGAGGLNNFLFGVNYRLSNNSYIGLEYGRETMDLYVQTDNQLILNQAQFYLMAKYGYSFSELEIFSGFYPYTEISIGSTSVGPITKARIGLIWEAFNLLKLYGNMESTGLRYSYLGNPEYTGKLSFNYGITIKL